MKLCVGVYGEDVGFGKGFNECFDCGCNQGILGFGWGSGVVDFLYFILFIDVLKDVFDVDKVVILERLDNELKKFDKFEMNDLCFVFVNFDGGEGFIVWKDVKGDRNDLYLQKGGDDFILCVVEGCGGGEGWIIVVFYVVGFVVVDNWIDYFGVGVVIMVNLFGQESGNVFVDIFFGDVNFSGKFFYIMGKLFEDYGFDVQVMYRLNGFVL